MGFQNPLFKNPLTSLLIVLLYPIHYWSERPACTAFALFFFLTATLQTYGSVTPYDLYLVFLCKSYSRQEADLEMEEMSFNSRSLKDKRNRVMNMPSDMCRKGTRKSGSVIEECVISLMEEEVG